MNTNSSITQLNELPKYFAIKRDANNPLWNKYIKWLNKKYNRNLSGDAQVYYGFGGENKYDSNFYSSSFSYFPNPVTEITLEQWDNIVNKKNEFLLYEKWCVKSTGKETYIKYLQPYLEKISYRHPEWNGNDHCYYFDNNKVVYTTCLHTPITENFKEITFEQFKKYVLKQDGMYTIEDLKNGKCTVINDGTPEELDIVLSAAEGNPCSRTYIKLACSKYYWTKNNYFWSNNI